jgi:hypothetical protein
MDERLRDAVGLPHPHPVVERLVPWMLRLRGRLVRLLPERRSPRLITQQKHRTYPHGYRIEELGPPMPTRATAPADGSRAD